MTGVYLARTRINLLRPVVNHVLPEDTPNQLVRMMWCNALLPRQAHSLRRRHALRARRSLRDCAPTAITQTKRVCRPVWHAAVASVHLVQVLLAVLL